MENEQPVAILTESDKQQMEQIWDKTIAALNLAIQSRSEAEYRTAHDNLIKESAAIWSELGIKYGFIPSGVYYDRRTGAIYRKPFLKGVHE